MDKKMIDLDNQLFEKEKKKTLDRDAMARKQR